MAYAEFYLETGSFFTFPSWTQWFLLNVKLAFVSVLASSRSQKKKKKILHLKILFKKNEK